MIWLVAAAGVGSSLFCYMRGYNAGVAYCMLQMKPLELAARDMAAMANKSRLERQVRQGIKFDELDPMESYEDALKRLGEISDEH